MYGFPHLFFLLLFEERKNVKNKAAGCFRRTFSWAKSNANDLKQRLYFVNVRFDA